MFAACSTHHAIIDWLHLFRLLPSSGSDRNPVDDAMAFPGGRRQNGGPPASATAEPALVLAPEIAQKSRN